MKRILLALSLAFIMVFALTGCGSENIENMYSFGTKVMTVGQSEVQVFLPYDIGQDVGLTATSKGNPETVYGGNDKHFFVMVSAIQGTPQLPLPSIQDQSKDGMTYITSMQRTTIQTQKNEMVSINGTPALKTSGTMTLENVSFSFYQYTFINKGVLWNIFYEYRTDDAVGAALAAKVVGHIQIT